MSTTFLTVVFIVMSQSNPATNFVFLPAGSRLRWWWNKELKNEKLSLTNQGHSFITAANQITGSRPGLWLGCRSDSALWKVLLK